MFSWSWSSLAAPSLLGATSATNEPAQVIRRTGGGPMLGPTGRGGLYATFTARFPVHVEMRGTLHLLHGQMGPAKGASVTAPSCVGMTRARELGAAQKLAVGPSITASSSALAAPTVQRACSVCCTRRSPGGARGSPKVSA